jgi:predicted acyltransferase
MLVANLVNVFMREVPSPLSHNQGNTLRVFDLPAPVFQFLVGVSLQLFLEARVVGGQSRRQARLDAIRRFTLLILLGMVLDGIAAFRPVLRWGVLQTLGLGGLVATVLDACPIEINVVTAIILLGVFSGAANGTVHGNPGAALAFAPLTIAGSVLGRHLRRAPEIAAGLVAFLAFGLALVLFASGVPFNKIDGTSSFVALSAAIAATALALLARIQHRGGAFPPWLLMVGRNALTAWVMLYVVVYYPAWLVFPSWQRLSMVPGAGAIILVTIGVCASTVELGRRGIRVGL